MFIKSVFTQTGVIFCCMLILTTAACLPGCAKKHLNQTAHVTKATDSEEQANQLIAYYFHRTMRCMECRQIENLSKAAIETNFANELKNNRIVWIAANIEEPDNRELAEKYNVVGSTLLIVDTSNGEEIRYKKLEKVWQYAENRNVFFDYVTREITDYLKRK